MFINTRDGFIPLARVYRIGSKRTPDGFVVSYDNGGGTERRTHTIDDPIEMPVTTVPAQPGTYALSVMVGEALDQVTRDPVIAWAIDAAGYPFPIVHGASTHDVSSCPILHPDGRVSKFQDSYESIDAWFADELAEQKSHQAREVAKAAKVASDRRVAAALGDDLV